MSENNNKNNVKFYALAALTVLTVVLGGIGIVASEGQGIIQTSSAVQVPQALTQAFTGLLIGLVTSAFAWLLKVIGWDLSSLATPFAISLATFLVGLVQKWIDLQPVTSDPWITVVLNILTYILAGIGGLALLARANNRNTLL